MAGRHLGSGQLKPVPGTPGHFPFYARQVWNRATHPSPQGDGIAVCLGHHHPIPYGCRTVLIATPDLRLPTGESRS
ncbi:hypothetical protein ABZ608_13865 [Streptomyces sp. NPDC013172]|uniref:hypothetical protein n=1 Tax=Streptomyces sp. NPDC013172 TaxID=3155009 RepID=UPI0033C0270B